MYNKTQNFRNSFLTNLVDNLFTIPSLTGKMKENATIKELLDELTLACCNILYETIQILEQVRLIEITSYKFHLIKAIFKYFFVLKGTTIRLLL